MKKEEITAEEKKSNRKPPPGRKKKEETTETVVIDPANVSPTITNLAEGEDIVTSTITLDPDVPHTFTETQQAPIIPPIEKNEFNKLLDSMPEVVEKKEIVGLSPMAIKWDAYLNMQRMTPDRFLEKYPKHPFKQFVEEIKAFRKS